MKTLTSSNTENTSSYSPVIIYDRGKICASLCRETEIANINHSPYEITNSVHELEVRHYLDFPLLFDAF